MSNETQIIEAGTLIPEPIANKFPKKELATIHDKQGNKVGFAFPNRSQWAQARGLSNGCAQARREYPEAMKRFTKTFLAVLPLLAEEGEIGFGRARFTKSGGMNINLKKLPKAPVSKKSQGEIVAENRLRDIRKKLEASGKFTEDEIDALMETY